jgi:hypothetical protein
MERRCLLCRRKRTSIRPRVTSAKCQERTHALQQIRGIKTRCQSCTLSGKVLAEPGGIRISSSAYDQARGTVPVAFTDLGEQRLKNIDLAPTR